MNLIEMEVGGVYIDPESNIPVIILKSSGSKDILPIWVGPLEASYILMQLQKIEPPRPLTPDLIVSLFLQNNIKVKKVIINEIRNNTYYAKIIYENRFKIREIDARPSDAISIALKVNAPILVNKKIITDAFSLGLKKNKDEYYREILEKLDKQDMEDAVM
ncbi:MAG: bifunctional nuclease family protein [bacterium]|nr:bifunctional nuclease family protein [bacterium]